MVEPILQAVNQVSRHGIRVVFCSDDQTQPTIRVSFVTPIYYTDTSSRQEESEEEETFYRELDAGLLQAGLERGDLIWVGQGAGDPEIDGRPRPCQDWEIIER